MRIVIFEQLITSVLDGFCGLSGIIALSTETLKQKMFENTTSINKVAVYLWF